MRIQKKTHAGHAAPNLSDYETERSSFSWDAAREELDGLPGGRGLNLTADVLSIVSNPRLRNPR